MTVFVSVKCYRKLVHSVSIGACKRDVHGLKREMETVVDLLVPLKQKSLDLGVLSISVDSRWEPGNVQG